ncbi:hypothetical protein [Paenibacillus cucumis (ex Kampfer et al. 2016)]|uniref:Aspartyl protease n=1 Tax=Paenibacillus cucumis (ex Kampfer et al. 2016) TaxID=1776858 RepID=A0ABS7KQ56_9BACL|nr:hypothetical protein [Paenibacillus cucumis (ex Kampfer et al. 2016)]MBY0206303.1 hypothetical protein [Paenibacillus cucumis (ex Kampfer et al. 2016)]
MKLKLINGLPIISLTVTHNERSIVLNNILFDTGCAATVFDTDALETIGSEIFYEQQVPDFFIGHIELADFPLQLGSIREPYGFDGIIDFMMRAKCKVDFESMSIAFEK